MRLMEQNYDPKYPFCRGTRVANSRTTHRGLFGRCSQGFCRIIWAHLICGLDENMGMDRDTHLVVHTS